MNTLQVHLSCWCCCCSPWRHRCFSRCRLWPAASSASLGGASAVGSQRAAQVRSKPVLPARGSSLPRPFRRGVLPAPRECVAAGPALLRLAAPTPPRPGGATPRLAASSSRPCSPLARVARAGGWCPAARRAARPEEVGAPGSPSWGSAFCSRGVGVLVPAPPRSQVAQSELRAAAKALLGSPSAARPLR